MKKIIVVLMCVLFLGGGVFLYFNYNTNVLGVVSPLAENALQTEGQLQVIFDRKTTQTYPPNVYFPKSLEPKYRETIDINSQAYAVMDRESGELLFGKNITSESPIASVTKIMTAVVALEQAALDVEIKVSSAAASIGEAEMGLTWGERVNVEELLYGLLLPSGNDAAEALAEGVGGRTSFMIRMNEKAQSLGFYDTFFFNPSGLDGETRATTNFSTALDLLALTNYALSNPTFAKIVATYYKEIPYKEGRHKAFYLNNILQLDRSYPGIRGVKPGVTDFAGETLVSYAENGGRKLIVVLLSTQNSRDEVVKLYDYVFPKLGVKISGRT